MTHEPSIETITPAELVGRAQQFRSAGYRLVQISATRLPESLELTYSFDLNGRLENLRFQLAPEAGPVPSITSVFWCAFLYENEMHDLFGIAVEGMAVDFKGNFYRTSVKHAFSATRPPAAAVAPAKPVAPAASPAVSASR